MFIPKNSLIYHNAILFGVNQSPLIEGTDCRRQLGEVFSWFGRCVLLLICCLFSQGIYALKFNYADKLLQLPSPFQLQQADPHSLNSNAVAIRQVEISINIVESTVDISKALGINLSMHAHNQHGLFIDLPNKVPGQGMESVRSSLLLGKLPGNLLLDLELNALEKENKTKSIARPKLLTLNKHKAIIEKGVEIPYKIITKKGATSTSFKKAVLRLEVLPEIVGDAIMLELQINQDTPLFDPAGGDPAINTNKIKTKILVTDRGTVMIGGIFKDLTQHLQYQVPLLGSIPVLGALFRNKLTVVSKSEIVVFVTPRIIF